MTTTTPAKTHIYHYTVQIFDTDCYGVMWHGAYVKWLELSRIQFLLERGINLKTLGDEHDVIFPVVEQNFKFHKSTKFMEELVFETTLQVQEPRLTFTQKVYRDETLVFEATTLNLLVNHKGKVYRKLPEVLELLKLTV